MSLVLAIWRMEFNMNIPSDFIELTNLKMGTDYTMPENYKAEFISEEVLSWTIDFYRANGLGEYLGGGGIDIMKPVHIFKDLFDQSI